MQSSDKSRLRQRHLINRQSITPTDHAAWSAACGNRLTSFIHGLSPVPFTIAAYMPVKGELDVTPALTQLAELHHILALPIADKEQRQLIFHRYQPGDTLVRGSYDIPEPRNPGDIVTPDVFIVPLLAFDHRGYRLGYGGGYYDTMLAALREVKPSVLAVGAAFSLQEEALLPAETHDERLDFIVTEKKVIAV